MKRLKAFVFILLVSNLVKQSQAQVFQEIDSLQNELQQAGHDTLRVNILDDLTWLYIVSESDLTNAKRYADSALNLARNVNYEKGFISALYKSGIIDRLKGNYDQALLSIDSCINYYKKFGYEGFKANALFQKAVIFDYQGKYQESLDIFFQLLKIHERNGDKSNTALISNSIGIMYQNLERYDMALSYYDKSAKLFRELNDPANEANVIYNTGIIRSGQKAYQDALDNFNEALELFRSIQNNGGKASCYSQMAHVYGELGQYNKAIQAQRESLSLNEELGRKKEQALNHNLLAHTYAKSGGFKEATIHFKKAEVIAIELGAKNVLKDVYFFMVEMFDSMRRYQDAYRYYKLYSGIKDSLINEENVRQINELQTKYETEQKENEIALLTKEQELQHAQLIQERNLRGAFMIGAILLLIILISLVINHRQKIRAKEMIARKNEEINRQKLLEMEKNQKLYALDAMISGQEVERKRIARDLHDGLGVLLVTVQNHFNSIQAEIEKIQKLDVYTKANQLLDEACTEVRKIAHNMMPGTLLKLGLAPAIKDMCDNMGRTPGIQVEFHAFGMDERLSEATEITVYRLAQEALNNVVKHAGATEVIVQLSRNNNQLTLTVEDNGAGFNVTEARKKGGMGLKNLESRVKYLNGLLNIASEAGKGTAVNIDIPVYQYETKTV